MGFVFFECKNNGKTRDFFKFEFDESANGLVHVDQFVWLWTVSEKKLTYVTNVKTQENASFFGC